MSSLKLRIMWCAILLLIVALLYRPHLVVTKPYDTSAVTPDQEDRVLDNINLELVVVGLLMIGGAVTMRSAATRAAVEASLTAPGSEVEPPQRDAKPTTEEPLLVLTDEEGRFVM